MKHEMCKRAYSMLWLAAALMFVLPVAVMAGSEEWIVGRHSGGATAVVYFQDGRRLASGGNDFRVKIWDVQTGEKLYSKEKHAGSVSALALSPDNKILVSAGLDDLLIVWDADTMSVLSKKSVDTTINSLAIAPDGTTLAAAGNDYAIRLYSLENGKLTKIKTLKKHTDRVRSVSFSPDGLLLASGSVDYTVKVWDLSQGVENTTCIKTFKKHTNEVSGVAFFSDGRLASASIDGTVRMYDMTTLTQVAFATTPPDWSWLGCISMAVSPDDHWIAGGSDDGYGVAWIQRNKDTLVWQPGRAEVNGDGEASVFFSPDSGELATASTDGTVKVIPTGLVYPLN